MKLHLIITIPIIKAQYKMDILLKDKNLIKSGKLIFILKTHQQRG